MTSDIQRMRDRYRLGRRRYVLRYGVLPFGLGGATGFATLASLSGEVSFFGVLLLAGLICGIGGACIGSTMWRYTADVCERDKQRPWA
jgi:MFS family permease